MSNKSSKIALSLMVVLSIFTIAQIIYLNNQEKHIDKKRLFVKTIGLPDFAISTEAKYIRHRSLTSIGEIFSENPESIEYFPTTFAYAPSPLLRNGR